MKKNSPALFCILAAVSITLIACSRNALTETATPAAITKIPVTQTVTLTPYDYKDLVVGFVQIGSENSWRNANIASFRDTAIALGITLKFSDLTEDLRQQQVRGLQQFIEDPNVNVIVILPHKPTGWKELLIKAKEAGKIVIIIDRTVGVSEDLYFTFVGNDFVAEGRKAGVEMCKLLENSLGKNIVEIQGTVGSGAQIGRSQGFREKIGDCGITIIQSQAGNFNTAEGKDAMSAILAQNPNI